MPVRVDVPWVSVRQLLRDGPRQWVATEQEIFQVTESLSATTFKTFELLSVVALNYLVLTAVWNVVQGVIETRLRAHELDESVQGWWQSLRYYLRPRASTVERRS